jgi:hypothetical protein
VLRLAAALSLPVVTAPVLGADDITGLLAAFRAVQAAEAWELHGRWITANPGALHADVEARFLAGASAWLSHPFLSQLERGLARPSMRSLTASLHARHDHAGADGRVRAPRRPARRAGDLAAPVTRNGPGGLATRAVPVGGFLAQPRLSV